ncbi:GNAT family N-acetyltransferase [Pseudomonas sp. CAU 1711]|uniref:GNAT family N-acetyltransferase n=1 Tax=Pseudomonas sp. CAU 1711 TaxID=3140356 RepID=UPI00326044AE
MEIQIDNLESSEITSFLEDHIKDMRAVSPPESKHALDISGLKAPEITFWSAYDNRTLIGCGALKEIDPHSGEIKSMRICSSCRGKGFGSEILDHIIITAKHRGYHSLKLETGSMEFFEPARRLYLKHGFTYCGAFGSYRPDPNSVFMELQLI